MISWAHVLAWPVAVVFVSANVRRAIAAAALARWSSDGGDTLIESDSPGGSGGVDGMQPVELGAAK